MKLSDLPPRLRRQLQASPRGRARSKYGAVRTAIGGRKFDSAKEARRYQDLLIQERAGAIADLQLQVPFELTINRQLVCRYVADFVYRRRGAAERTVEDVKSAATRRNRAYRIKLKLMRAVHGISITEV